VVKNIYESSIQKLNFRSNPQKASEFINNWVSNSTHGKIKDIVPSVIDPNTRVVLANALYFEAEWQQTFIDGATGLKKFYPLGRNHEYHIMAELMAHGGKFPHYYSPELDVEILGLPYKQNCTTMYVIMPKNSDTDKVKSIQKRITGEKLEDLINNMTIKTAIILFPKMHLQSSHYLKADLQDLGVKALFRENESDLSLIADTHIQYKDQIVFKDPISRHRDPVARHRDPLASYSRVSRDVTYKVKSESKKSPNLSVKDFFNRKRIIKSSHGKKNKKTKRDVSGKDEDKVDNMLNQLDVLREQSLLNPRLYADEIIHKVDLEINEKGTKGNFFKASIFLIIFSKTNILIT
jgi:serine protease inhibitor